MMAHTTTATTQTTCPRPTAEEVEAEVAQMRWAAQRGEQWDTSLSGAAALLAGVDGPAAAAVRALLHDGAQRLRFGAWPGDAAAVGGGALLLLAALVAEQAGRVAALERQVERLAALVGREPLARSAQTQAQASAANGAMPPTPPAATRPADPPPPHL